MQERKLSTMAYITGAWPLDPEKATLVFIHGAGGSSVLWREQVEALKDKANTIAIDLPGHGRSPGPGRDKIEDYAGLVAEFIGEVSAPRPVAVGLSMGGAITLQLLLDYPDKFCAGILIATGSKLRVMPQIFETIEKDFNAFIDLTASFALSPKTDPEALRPLMEDSAMCEPGIVADDFRACNVFDVMARLGEIKVPVLVVTGEDDKLTPPKYGQFMVQSIPKAQSVHIMDAGHLSPAEKPEEVNMAIADFLENNLS